MSLFDRIRSSAAGDSLEAIKERAEARQKAEENLLTVEYPKHSKDAKFIRLDVEEWLRWATIFGGMCERISQNQLAVLYALNMLTVENVVRYANLSTNESREKLKQDALKAGVTPFFFDEVMNSADYKNKRINSSLPPKEMWGLLKLEKVDEESREFYPCEYRLSIDMEGMKPFYEVWLEGEALKKYQRHLELMAELNSFFEKGASPSLVMKYFGTTDNKGKIAFDASALSRHFAYVDTMKK